MIGAGAAFGLLEFVVGFAPSFVNLFPNQNRGIDQQLAEGVRGFMLDIYQTKDGAILCHQSCFWVSRPVALWVDLKRMVEISLRCERHAGTP